MVFPAGFIYQALAKVIYQLLLTLITRLNFTPVSAFLAVHQLEPNFLKAVAYLIGCCIIMAGFSFITQCDDKIQ